MLYLLGLLLFLLLSRLEENCLVRRLLARRRKLAEAVANHVLYDGDGYVAAAVVDVDRLADPVWENH